MLSLFKRNQSTKVWRIIIPLFLVLFLAQFPAQAIASGNASHGSQETEVVFPKALSSYHDSHMESTGQKLIHRIKQEPLNIIVTIMFLCAIVHTFCVGFFRRKAEQIEKEFTKKMKKVEQPAQRYDGNVVHNVSFAAEILYFFGEVEIVFGLWVFPVFISIVGYYGWDAGVGYFSSVNFTEPIFVLAIMVLASSRPIMRFAEKCLHLVASIGKGTTAAWWLTVLTVGPILGSFITEPGAMTISALILGKQFYEKKPSLRFAYATIGLLFVNVSVGGTLTHFAAPPVLMIAGAWDWNLTHMLTNFGWKAVCGIIIANLVYYSIFKNELKKLNNNLPERTADATIDWDQREDKIPLPITLIHIVFLVWTVFTAHHPHLFLPGFFVFMGFRRATAHHQNDTNLKPAMLVAFFLAGLVTHGGLQGWWISPILGSLGEFPLMLGATVLTAFNDNAAITYLSSLVPTFTDTMKYAVVAGAVTGGGLTVIANAPNPAGVSVLRKYFQYGVAPAKLALGALIPTIILFMCFWFLP